MAAQAGLPRGDGPREEAGDMLCGLLEPSGTPATFNNWLLLCCWAPACMAAAAAAAAGTEGGVG